MKVELVEKRAVVRNRQKARSCTETEIVQHSEALNKWISIVDGTTNPPGFDEPTVRDRLIYLEKIVEQELAKASSEIRQRAAITSSKVE